MPIDFPQLPVDFMNADHAHAVSQLEAMKAVLPAYAYNREPLVLACREFLRHNREHFAREEAAMHETGFPAFAIHKREHERVLHWLETLAGDIAAGQDIAAVTQAIHDDIPAWFVQHTRTMDSATAAWIASRQHSGVGV